MLGLNFSLIWSPIHLIAQLLINWIAICMYSQMEYCFKPPLKMILNGLNQRKNNGPTSLNIYKHDNSYAKTFGGGVYSS